jgi:putative endonuclease
MAVDQAYVYIMANSRRTLYVGVTTRLGARIQEHKRYADPKSFTARYRITRLVYYECYASISQAIARETEIKGLLRVKKIQLIAGLNPAWEDLSAEWGRRIKPFDESQLQRPTTF